MVSILLVTVGCLLCQVPGSSPSTPDQWKFVSAQLDPDQLLPRIYKALAGMLQPTTTSNSQVLGRNQRRTAEPSGSLGNFSSKGLEDKLPPISQRLLNVRARILRDIPVALASVREDIVIANRDKVVLALTNFLGSVFGCLMPAKGNFKLSDFTLGQYLSVTAQALYGYGYWAPFIFEVEQADQQCGLKDYEAVEQEYNFLEGPQGAVQKSINAYYIKERSNRLKKSIYCIYNRKGSNSDAARVIALIELEATLMLEVLNRPKGP